MTEPLKNMQYDLSFNFEGQTLTSVLKNPSVVELALLIISGIMLWVITPTSVYTDFNIQWNMIWDNLTAHVSIDKSKIIKGSLENYLEG